MQVATVAILNKVFLSVFTNDIANASDSTDNTTGANKVRTSFGIIFSFFRIAVYSFQSHPVVNLFSEWFVFSVGFSVGHGSL